MNEDQALEKFRRRKILTIEELVSMLECSMITTRRRLKQWRTHTSINQNGRYYTLPRIPVFDQNGLWRYQAVLFSRHGNLKRTIVALIEGSPEGMSAAEIAGLVDLAPNSSFLSRLKDAPGVRREKRGGRFVYLSDQPDVYARQKGRWPEIGFPTNEQTVAILVQLIKHPDSSVSELAVRASERGASVAPDVVRDFLRFHDLLKKTADTKAVTYLKEYIDRIAEDHRAMNLF